MSRSPHNDRTNKLIKSPKIKKAGLIGLGRISFTNDFFACSKGISLTHFSNLRRFDEYVVHIGVDPDQNARHFFKEKTGIACVSSIEEINGELDFVVISTPTDKHLMSTIELLKQTSPRHIVIEKPLGNSLYEAHEICRIIEAQGAKLYVPYPRRYNPEMILFKEAILAKEYGDVKAVTVQYGQGLMQNGCHFVNLIDFLLGGISDQVTSIDNCDEKNPSWKSYSASGEPIHFIGVNTKLRSGEVRIICEDGEFVIGQGGNITYCGRRNLSTGWIDTPLETKNHDSRLNMQYFYDAVMHPTQAEDTYHSDIHSALRTQTILSKVLN
jgi:predicted dehydrogenase